MKKKKTVILKWFLIVVFLLLVVDKCLSTLEVGFGSNSLDSPNGRYEAYFHSFSIGGLLDAKQVYRFEVFDVNDKDDSFSYTDEKRVKCVNLEVLHREVNIDLNRGSEYIEWSPSSSEVTYAFEDIELKLKIDEQKE